MSNGTIVMIAMTIGSLVGSYIPVLWGADVFSLSSIIFGGIGGLAGIYVAYRITSY